MTLEELHNYDSQLANGEICDYDYDTILKDEIARIHPEIPSIDIDNMIRQQMRTLAVEETVAYDNNSVRITERVDNRVDKEAVGTDGNENENAVNATESNGAASITQIKPDESLCKDNNGTPDKGKNSENNGDEGKGELRDNGNGSGKDSGEEEDEDKLNSQNNNDDKSKDKNNKGGEDSNRFWMTYQIVPYWLTVGNDAENCKGNG